MGEVVNLSGRQAKQNSDNGFNIVAGLDQATFKSFEIRAIGDIQSSLVSIGFSQDPTMKFTAVPDKEGDNNRVILEVDVANIDYQKIFGEVFNISITKFHNQDGANYFKMETPLSKSSGTFCEVIAFVQNFINTNLKPNDGCVRTLIASH